MGQFFDFFRVLLVGRRFQWVGQFFDFFLADYLLVAVLLVGAFVVVIAVLVVVDFLVAALVVVIAFLVVVTAFLVVVIAVVGAWVVRAGGVLKTWRELCVQRCLGLTIPCRSSLVRMWRVVPWAHRVRGTVGSAR